MRRWQVRTLQSQRQGGRGGVAEGAGAGGRGDGRHPSVKEAKKAEMEAWLAAEIEVRLCSSHLVLCLLAQQYSSSVVVMPIMPVVFYFILL